MALVQSPHNVGSHTKSFCFIIIIGERHKHINLRGKHRERDIIYTKTY